jgi:hypothetical protein
MQRLVGRQLAYLQVAAALQVLLLLVRLAL